MSTVDAVLGWVIFACLALFAGLLIFGLALTHKHRVDTLRRAGINTRPMHLAAASMALGAGWLVVNALPTYQPSIPVVLAPVALSFAGGYLLARLIMRAIEVDKVRDHIKRLQALHNESAETK